MKDTTPESGMTENSVIMDFLSAAMVQGHISWAMVHQRGPDGSFPWVLVRDPDVLERAEAIPPVMSVQGAKALASFAQSHNEGLLIAVLRPCEARAAVELSKLEQIDPENVILLTMDCPGVVPLPGFNEDAVSTVDQVDESALRPLCRQCTEFTATGDICLASHGIGEEVFVPLTDKGKALLEAAGFDQPGDISGWEKWKEDLKEERLPTGMRDSEEMRKAYEGLEGLSEVFSGCIGCRSCRTVCPICYCRLCFIDMKDRRSTAEEYMDRSGSAGAARLVSNTLLFHITRMAHMSLSCVSCGMCEDACPSDIPVGRLVSMVSRGTTELFDYHAGFNGEEPLPLNTFRLDELHEYED